MRPEPYRDEALLQALATTAARRWVGGWAAALCCLLLTLSALAMPPLGSPLLSSLPCCRLQSGQERPSPQAVGLICLAFGSLRLLPRCFWCVDRGLHANVLDDLGAALVQAGSLQQASPQASAAPLPTQLGACSPATAVRGMQ